MVCERLTLILGDQLDRASPVLQGLVHDSDPILMIESREESRRIPSHKARTAFFLAAMRHHAGWLRQQGHTVDYVTLNHADADTFGSALSAALQRCKPRTLRMVKAGEYGVQQNIEAVCSTYGTTLDLLEDTHFYCSSDAFSTWRSGRRKPVMEHFYRWVRQTHDVLMDGKQPVGGEWNLDKQNRKTFGKNGPGMLPSPIGFAPDKLTHEVLAEVTATFPDNPGELQHFDWPVTREQALEALTDFIEHRLPAFGPFQDAMWQDEPWLYHSHLSAALNLKLLNPREVVDAAVAAYQEGRAPLNSVEGFIRQIIGWREYVRGIYWSDMPDYLQRNALNAQQPLPAFYWTAETDMHCLAQVIGQTLRTGYAHHIQRLMVTGLFAMLFGVRPLEIHRWYLAVYVDAVEWVEAPNTLGMSQHADGGLLGSKPYAASGRYIQRMSNYCDDCRYRPGLSTGELACPFTTLYWDFLIRHEMRFGEHPRTAMQWRMLTKLDTTQRRAIVAQANDIRSQFG